MTQCWQHCPEHRPNFSTILERVNYCTQVPWFSPSSAPLIDNTDTTIVPCLPSLTFCSLNSLFFPPFLLSCSPSLSLPLFLCLSSYLPPPPPFPPLFTFSPSLSQDPDVITTPLPVEYDPTVEEDGSAALRPETSSSLTPLLVSHSSSQDPSNQLGGLGLGLGTAPMPLPQPHKPRLLLQRPQQLPQEVTSYREALEPSWAEPVPAIGACQGAWLHHRPCSRSSSSSGSQRLKNKTKNLWNPTYGSWVLESFGRGKKALAHTQSMPLSTSSSTSTPQSATPNTALECPESGWDGSSSLVVSNPSPSPSCQTLSASQAPTNLASRKCPTGGAGTVVGMDLAKLQSFPCGNVNYAYDEQSYEAESLPLVVPKAPEPSSSSGTSTITGSAPSCSSGSGSGSGLGLALGLGTTSSCMPKLLLKRHASYGHEDVRRHTKAEKPTRDRDSGFSLSEDLSVTPV